MRYLGNKNSIIPIIENLLLNKGLLDKNLIFFDAFCGSGTVSDYMKKYFNIIINDNLTWATIYTYGKICAERCNFKNLSFDPFEYFNNNDESIEGFIYKTYAPTYTNRMYFTIKNAGRIDYFRQTIQKWFESNLISMEEYSYLLACLIESVSDVSNTAGVYGAFLKKWDQRATKEIKFNKVDHLPVLPKDVSIMNFKTEDIIENIECDILYLDPPYTQNQYGTQYHLLETLILDDEPSVSPITGSRSTSPMRSDWSKNYKAHILLDKVLAKTRAKYVIMSYNNDGFMSKEYIEAVFKRYGKLETYSFISIPYKKYKNWKSENNNDHYEYLFFIELKNKKNIYYESPLNYIGNKTRIVKNIFENIPQTYEYFYDVFGGGFNVGINSKSNYIYYNDINKFVKELIEIFYQYETYDLLLYLKKMINKFNLQPAKSDSYLQARSFYNSLPVNKRDPRLLFTIIMYGFQQQIRFNSNHEFNNPVGMRWLNDKILEKIISFSRHIKEINCYFCSEDYNNFLNNIRENSFVYLDPPYMLTTGAYNDGKRGFNGWNEDQEAALFEFANNLTQKQIPFMLSYVVEHKGKTNDNLLNWITANNYRLIPLGNVLGISGSKRKEVLVVNYD